MRNESLREYAYPSGGAWSGVARTASAPVSA
jgi:hypothetical protein